MPICCVLAAAIDELEPRNFTVKIVDAELLGHCCPMSIKRISNTFKMQMHIIRNLFAMFER